MWQGRTVGITGATGFLGGWLTQFLLERGARVVALVRDLDPESRFARLASRVVQVKGELQDLATLQRMFMQYETETVFHIGAQALVGLALKDPIDTFESNIRGTWNVLEAARRAGVRELIVASSDKAYGSKNQELYREDASLDGIFPYDVSKSCTDLLCRSYHATYKLPVVITRCGNFFGGGDLNWSRLVPSTVRSVIHNERPQLRSDGQYVRDYLYIEDAALAYLHLAEKFIEDKSLSGEAFNFSLEQPWKVVDLTREILSVMESDLEPEILNLPEARMEIPVQLLSAEKARTRLGWGPRYTMREGLTRTIEWYRKHLTANSQLG